MQNKVSVIVPVYGVEDYLERCLESLVNQTLQDIEIIVVNDGSPDNSQEIIDKYVEKYPDKIKGFIKENGGLSDARNYGIPHATGEFIAFVDSDDYVDLTMYEKLYNKAKEEDSEVVVCGYFKVNDADFTMKSAQMGSVEFYNSSPHDVPALLEISAPYAWNKLVKKELLDRTGIIFPKGYLFEDICTMYPILSHAKKISKVDEELYYYIVERKDSITATFNKSRTLILKSLKLLNERFIENGDFDEFRDQLVVINLRHMYFRFKEFGKYKDRKHQIQLVNECFSILHKYFPDWKKNSGNYVNFTLKAEQTKKRWLYKRRLYWLMVAVAPLRYIQAYEEKDYKKWHPGSDFKRHYVETIQSTQVIKNTVLIESFHGKNISDSPYCIMKELLKTGGYKIYTVSDSNSRDKNKRFIKKNKLKVELLNLKSERYYEILATAQYLVNNVSFPPCFVKREGQTCINTWHGTPLKTLGKNMKKGIESMHNIQHNFLQSDYLLFPNEFTKDRTMEDYNLEQLFTNKTIVSGYPRNAVFSDEQSGLKIKEKLGLKDKKIYVYMPTWRGINSYGKMKTTDVIEILSKLDENLDENHLLFVNLHPNVGEDIDYSNYKYIDKFPEEIPNYEFVNCSDALITDYSSIFFDYSITKKPIVLFMYDYDEYMEDRGMYMDIMDLPFKKIFNMEDMCEIIKSKEILQCTYSEAKDYFDKFTKYDSIDTTKKIVDCVFNQKEEGLIIEDYKKNKEKKWKVKVQLERIENKDEYDKFIYSEDLDNTIFVIRNVYFNALMNTWFYEEYNKKVTFIVFGYCRLLDTEGDVAFKTEGKKTKPQRKKAKETARRRAFKRSLPGITVINKEDIKRII